MATLTVPSPGTWITDGVRLVEVVAVEPNGDLIVEDARVPLGTDPPPNFRVTAVEWANHAWLTLTDWKRAKEAHDAA